MYERIFKDNIKRILAKNSYINAGLYTLLSAKSLSDMKLICAEASQDDSIADISWLKQFRKYIKNEKKRFYTTDCNFSNAHIYGIWQALFGDLGVDTIYTPSVEHGLIFHNQIFNDIEDTSRAACVTFGEFRRKIIRQYTKIPVFCVGPYIHYATSFYSEEKIKEERKKNGKTLLFFPRHSTNRDELKIEIERYRKYLYSKQSDFDTILVNTFWWNINDPLTDALKADGYRIVSAGFRDDIMFMRRLKTIIKMSDFAIGDSIGTHVGYCIHLGVPFCYEPLGSYNITKIVKEKKDYDFCTNHINNIANAFTHSQMINDVQREICNYYWGEQKIKSKEEIVEIVEITREIMKYSHGWGKKNSDVTKKLLNTLSGKKLELLKDAII